MDAHMHQLTAPPLSREDLHGVAELIGSNEADPDFSYLRPARRGDLVAVSLKRLADPVKVTLKLLLIHAVAIVFDDNSISVGPYKQPRQPTISVMGVVND